MSKIYTCCICDKTFLSDRPDSEAKQEYKNLYGDFAGKDEHDLVCADCYKRYLIWHNSLSEADHKRIQGEVNAMD